MGFFSWVGSKIRSACRAVKNFLFGDSEDVGRSSSLDDNSSVVTVAEMGRILEGYSRRNKEIAATNEKNFKQQVRLFYDEVTKVICKNDELKENVSKSLRLEKAARDLQEQIEGVLDGTVGSRISLDDAECRQILAMRPGEDKKRAMQRFCEKVQKEANELLAQKVKRALTRGFDEIADEVDDYMGNKERTLKKMARNYAVWEESAEEGTLDSEKTALIPALKLTVLDRAEQGAPGQNKHRKG